MGRYKWDSLLKFRLIEIVAYWEGRVSTTHLINSFKIGRQQASHIINEYIRDIAPTNLEYDNGLKGYKPTATFKPVFTTGLADEYLHLVSQLKDTAHGFSPLDLSFTHSEFVQPESRIIAPDILRAVITAINTGLRLDIGYVSLNHPDSEGRIIAPHTLVCTQTRWHVRAYCEKNNDFRDFVLSRLRGPVDIMGKASHTIASDSDWNQFVTVNITPHPSLSPEQKQVVEQDHQMVDHQLVIRCRVALIPYVLQAYDINPAALPPRPEAQPLTVVNWHALAEYVTHLTIPTRL